MEEVLKQLFLEEFGEEVIKTEVLPEHASRRKLFRLFGQTFSCIGVYHEDLSENKAFISFSKSFLQAGLPVPKIFRVDSSYKIYLEEDLGDDTLYNLLQKSREADGQVSDQVIDYYQQALSYLVKFQTEGIKCIDFSYCYQGDYYSAEAMLRDLQAYEQWFLKTTKTEYDYTQFHKDTIQFSNYLATAPNNFFMYRDFQARNIMIKDRQLYFIDYQTGRKGPLQCDVVSLLYQSQANLSDQLRYDLLQTYLDELSNCIDFSRSEFEEHYYNFVLIRLFQVLATYGREGLINKKEYFLKGIPVAQRTLKQVVESYPPKLKIPELVRLAKCVNNE